MDETSAGYMFSAELGVYAVVAILAGKLSDKLPKKRFSMIVFGLCVQGLGLVMVGPSILFKFFNIYIIRYVKKIVFLFK